MATKIPTYVAGTFYVADSYGDKKAGGKDFDTLEAAEAAAQRSVRLAASSKRAHGWTPFDVKQAIPGHHVLCSVVYPDKIERLG